MEEEIVVIAEEAIRKRVFPGCVIGVVRKDGTRSILPFGGLTYEEDAPCVTEKTLYDLASITKSILTASLILMLIDQGRLKLEDKLKDFIPEFRNSDRDVVTIRHLLTYTIDGYGTASLKAQSADELFEILCTRDFEARPGTVFKYTNVPAILLGLVVERIYGKRLDIVAQEELFGPLGMERTTFHPEVFDTKEIAPTEIDEERGVVQGVVHDESAYVCAQGGRSVGHAGLFSTGGDLLIFLEMLLNRGVYKGRRYLSEAIIDTMCTNQIPELGTMVGLGWELNQPSFMGRHAGPRAFGRGGFTGTSCVCDIEKGLAYVLLSNRAYPRRPADIGAFRALSATTSADIGNIVFGAYA